MSTQHEAQKTRDHKEIRQWTEKRGGRPATVKGTEATGEKAGLLRIAFDDDGDLQTIEWQEFFDKFDEENLVFLYQEETKDGEESRFFKFVEE